MSQDTFDFKSVSLDANTKVTIVAAKWNGLLVDSMVKSASERLQQAGCKHINIVRVPGAWELVHASQQALMNSDGVLSFGVVIRGETTHYELISEAVAQGLMQVSIAEKKPIGFGLIAAENFEQAQQRTDVMQLDKGKEVAQSLLEMLV